MKKELKINLQTPVARYAPGESLTEIVMLGADANENLQSIKELL
jgi:hypothetical protein